ncbi:MAG: type IV pilin protein [Methylophilaceae bacterium]
MIRIKDIYGFTLIEVLVVMAIVATLLSIAAPRYFDSMERSKEAILKQDLTIMRDAIDKFYSDTNSYPNKLDELVTKKYLRTIPLDPITESSYTWIVIPPPTLDLQGAVYDVRSGAPGLSFNGSPYKQW